MVFTEKKVHVLENT